MNTTKDFGPILDAYAFFETHATEAAEDARAYRERLAGLGIPPAGDAPIRLLDFGCGPGTFSARLLGELAWPPDRLRLMLVEPVDAARQEAAAKLVQFTDAPIADAPELPPGTRDAFDLIIANHVFYYTPDLDRTLGNLAASLVPGGRFLTAIAGQANVLIGFWNAAFARIGRPVPYHTAEDVAASLDRLGTPHERHPVPYDLTFPDAPDNRMKILRFLLADYLAEMPAEELLGLFDPYVAGDRIVIRTGHEQFVIRKA